MISSGVKTDSRAGELRRLFLDNMTSDRSVSLSLSLPRFGVIHLFNWSRPWPELLEDQFR